MDASGDGDIYAAAGAEFQKVKDNIGLVSRIGNVSVEDMFGADREITSGNRAKSKGARPTRGVPVSALEGNVGSPTPAPRTNWLNMKGPVADGLDVAVLSALELRHRRAIWNNLERARRKPGAEQAYLAETAPQMGIRLTHLNSLLCGRQKTAQDSRMQSDAAEPTPVRKNFKFPMDVWFLPELKTFWRPESAYLRSLKLPIRFALFLYAG